MYAVVSSGGKQYRVEPGATLTMERLGVEPGATLTFDRVLLVGDGDEVTVGAPLVGGASVSATVLGEELGPKLVIFKFKQKVKYRRRTGHRQRLVRIRIDAISADGKTTKAAKPEAKPRPAGEAGGEAQAEPGEAVPKPRTSRRKASKQEASKGEAVTGGEARASRRRSTRTKAQKAEAKPADEAKEQ